ncbi:extracellular solute-binding protein [Blastochloris sulfoviridis]|uniref:ABC transporter substrate-binding protein n=1 Tax=Blastochloris sulfoviridis TaxID=50712 RepID=A0A5M6I5G1_9HYPH|nr:extracellular solute-binding protein [Blastochloris sulfoviridis]KAA5603432.1 ABC transporter substrate-binding protein [Blastochloris sulfoviridis]
MTVLRLTRRGTLAVFAGAAASPFAASPFAAGPFAEGPFAARADAAASPAAAPVPEVHGMSAFGDLKYPAGFSHFDYVDPKAPKGGSFSQIGPTFAYNQNPNTFNTMNMFVLRGDGAQGLELTFASLMARALDEPDAMYGLAAQAVAIDPEGLEVRFRLRPGITFHDGTPITPEDVVFSLDTLKREGHPRITQALSRLESTRADGDVVAVRFAPDRARDAPLFVAGLPILSKAYYAGKAFDAATLEPPLGSGPYRVGRMEPGRFIEYVRVADWWGADLPAMRGSNNFDVVRYEYFRDRDVGFEAFKAGEYLFREEFTSRVWARGYDFPALKDRRVVRDETPDNTPSGTQGWFLNTRREVFKDRRVREALQFAFDFEWVNQNVMFGSYFRAYSFFQNSNLEAHGAPDADELALLEPLRDRLDPDVFGAAAMPPVSDGSGQDRSLLRRAVQLLDEAGWRVQGGKRVNARGEPLAIEFLMFERSFEPHHAALIKNLKLIGVEGTMRLVDPVQYQARRADFDFDVIVQRFNLGPTPSEVLRSLFSSSAAGLKGSDNLAGIADPAVDRLIEAALAAPTRADLVAACRALDRVLRAGRYWVPHWYKASHWLAYWDVFGRPATKPHYGRGAPETWWRDAAKSAKIGR